MIDISVALCGCGTGGFVKAMMQYGLFPFDTHRVVPEATVASGMVRNGENEYMSMVMDFNGEIAVMAARLGLMARHLRREAERETYTDEASFVRVQMGSSHRQQQISAIQQNLRWKWNQVPPELMMGVRDKTLPSKLQGYYDHVSGPTRCCFAARYLRVFSARGLDRRAGAICAIANLHVDFVMLQTC